MSEFDFYIPLRFNNGKAVPKAEIERIKKQLTKIFGGVTDFRHRIEGIWKFGEVLYRDEILIIRVMGQKTKAAMKQIRKLRLELQERLRQKELLVVERKIQVCK